MMNPKHSPLLDSRLRVTFAGRLMGLQIRNGVNCINGSGLKPSCALRWMSSLPVMKLVDAVPSAVQFWP